MKTLRELEHLEQVRHETGLRGEALVAAAEARKPAEEKSPPGKAYNQDIWAWQKRFVGGNIDPDDPPPAPTPPAEVYEETDDAPGVIFHKDGTATVCMRSVMSHKTYKTVMPITLTQFFNWQSGGLLAQEAFPHLSADQREFLMTGFTPSDWAKMFPKGDE